MRTLYYVPIIHTLEDYGVLRGQIAQSIEQRHGAQALARMQGTLRDFWQLVRQRVFDAIHDPTGLIIYQDSLPAGPRNKILALFGYYLAENPQSENFLFVKELLENGAILEWTEDARLMKAQIDLMKSGSQDEDRADDIMYERDVFIARRINETLPENGTAIIFMGRKHKVIEELDKLEEAEELLFPLRVIYL